MNEEAASIAEDGQDEKARGSFGVERINALTDGIFAIVLTLLVLELKIPNPNPDATVIDLLVLNWHDFVAWIISFLALMRFWLIQHALMQQLHRCDRITLLANFAVLLTVSTVPFSSALVGQFNLASSEANVLFALNIALISLSLGLLAHHGGRAVTVLRSDGSIALLDRHRRHHLVRLPLLALAAAAISLVVPPLALVLLAVEFVTIGAIGLLADHPEKLDAPSVN